jgi:hypothetical protein
LAVGGADLVREGREGGVEGVDVRVEVGEGDVVWVDFAFVWEVLAGGY